MDWIGTLASRAYLSTNGSLAGLRNATGICMFLMMLTLGITQYVWAQTEPVSTLAGQGIAIQLDQASLKDALKVLEQESGISIVFNEQYLPDRLLSGKFAGQEAEDILEKLLYASSLRVVRTGDFQIVIAPEEGANARKVQTTEIRGIVRDKETGTTLVGATVYSAMTQKGIITDINGQFTLKELPAHQRTADTLVVQFVGYEPLYIPTAGIQPNQVIVAELGLHSVTLDEVQVTAETDAGWHCGRINQSV